MAASKRNVVAGQRTTAVVGAGAATAAARGQGLARNQPDRVEDRQGRQQNREGRRDQVGDQVAEKYPRMDFWSDHTNWAAYRISNPYHLAAWGSVAGWIGYQAQPQYSTYGDVYYQDDGVYSESQQVATADEYADQAAALAASVPDTKPQDAEWLPLGVFAVTQDGQSSGPTPSCYMQLAISKDAVISGVNKNMVTGDAEALEGVADKKTQRVAWNIKGKQSPIMETGLANLTQDTVPVLFHFADGKTQRWLLVRLPEPKEN